MGVLGLAPFLQKTCPEVIKKLPDRFRGLAGKKVVIDGTLITQRLHYAPAPHPYRHVQMWYKLAREFQEAGVSAICVFDGKERHSAKAREAARRKELQRKARARGTLEIDRSKRLKHLSDVFPSFQILDDMTQRRTTDLLHQLALDSEPQEEIRQNLTATTSTGDTRSRDFLHKPTEDLSQEHSAMRLSVDVDFAMPIPKVVADETVGDDRHIVSDYVDSLLLEAELTHIESSPAHIPLENPWTQEPNVSFDPGALHLSFESGPEPDVYTTVAPEHIVDDFHPYFRIEDSPSSSTYDPELPYLENATSHLSFEDIYTNTHDIIPESHSSENNLSLFTPSQTILTPKDLLTQLSSLYLSYYQSPSRLATLSDSLDSSPPSIPNVGDPDTQPDIIMTKAQYQLTLEEGRFWNAFSTEPRGPKLPDTLENLFRTSEVMSASFERRMNPPTLSTYNESKEILKAMGVPCLETSGAYEAEALACSMVLNGLADYVVSEDTDVLIYEVPLVRNFTSKDTPLTLVSGAEIRAVLQLDRASFVDFALLLGTDFSQRIKNVGPIRALKFIREHGSIERVIELETKYAPPMTPQAYLDQIEVARIVFRTLPPVPDAELLEQDEPDEVKVVEVLQRYGLGKEVMVTEEWDYGAALKGNYFEDDPSAF